MVGREPSRKIILLMENNLQGNNIIDGRAIASKLFEEINERVKSLSFQPLLCDVVVGDDPVSLSYVNIKSKRAKQCGMEFSLVQLPESATELEVIEAIKNEQAKSNLCGLIVQLPLPEHLNAENILREINPEIDVDGINPNSTHALVPPTAGAVMHLLDSVDVNLQEETFVVVGYGDLVGKPVTELLKKRNYNYEVVLADTGNRAEILKSATVVISAAGKAGVLTGDQLADDIIVIDAGTSEQGGSIAGDVDFETVAKKAKFITPSPGGVGPVTVAKLLENVLIVAEQK